jgi:hypothetical protein
MFGEQPAPASPGRGINLEYFERHVWGNVSAYRRIGVSACRRVGVSACRRLRVRAKLSALLYAI